MDGAYMRWVCRRVDQIDTRRQRETNPVLLTDFYVKSATLQMTTALIELVAC
jgi:hypothetical protein